MVEVSVDRRASGSCGCFKRNGVICRLIQLVLLLVVEGFLAVAVSQKSDRALAHLLVASIPLTSIGLLIAAHGILGPYEAWPQCQRCSWTRLEVTHDIIVFIWLLPSALVLFMPPFSVYEITGAVLTLVTVTFVALHGVETLQKMQNRSTLPLVTATNSVNSDSIPRTRRPRRDSLPYFPPTTTNSQHYQSSTPFNTQECFHPGRTNLVSSRSRGNIEFESGVQYTNTTSPLKIRPVCVAAGTQRTESGSPKSSIALHPRVNVLRKSHGVCTPDTENSKNHVFSPSNNNNHSIPSSVNSDCIEKDDLSTGSSPTVSFECLPVIKLTEPIPDSRITRSEIGTSPALHGNLMSPSRIAEYCNSDSLIYNHTGNFENPDCQSTASSVNLEFICSEEPVSQDPLVKELSERLSTNPTTPYTSHKPADEFSPPKIFSNNRLPSGSPQPAPRKVVPIKSFPVPSSRSPRTMLPSPVPQPRQSQKLVSPNTGVLPKIYVPVYPNVCSYKKDVRGSRSLPVNFSGSAYSAEIEGNTSAISESQEFVSQEETVMNHTNLENDYCNISQHSPTISTTKLQQETDPYGAWELEKVTDL